MRHDEIRLLTWRQVDLVGASITVGLAKTKHSTGRVIPLNTVVLKELKAWAQQFPNRRQGHYVFPAEMVGLGTDDAIAVVYDVGPTRPIGAWNRMDERTRQRRRGEIS